jgi:hypothetical protein
MVGSRGQSPQQCARCSESLENNDTMNETAIASILRQVDRDHLRPRSDNVSRQRERAERFIRAIDSGPDENFEVRGFRHHGSLSRGTGLKGFEDWDTIVILDAKALETQRGTQRTPARTIGLLASVLERMSAGMLEIGNMSIRRQKHSVGVCYPRSKFRIDLVPGLSKRERLYIPERGTGEWIRTDPDGALERVKRATVIERDTLCAIRLLKGWSRARGKGQCALPSFAIETWVVAQIQESRPSLADVVLGFIESLADNRVGSSLVLLGQPEPKAAVTLLDPSSGNNLTSEVTKKQARRLVNTARDSRDKIDELRREVAAGKSRSANRLARDLFVGWRR